MRNPYPHVYALNQLSTIADFAKIFVLGASKEVEFGTPCDSMDKGGVFRSLIDQTSERVVLRRATYG